MEKIVGAGLMAGVSSGHVMGQSSVRRKAAAAPMKVFMQPLESPLIFLGPD